MQIYLFETTADDGSGIVNVRMATGEGYNHPTSPAFMEGRIMGGEGLKVLRTIMNRNEFGLGEIDFGQLAINNNDGALDAWLDYAWGKCGTLKLGDIDAPYDEFQQVLGACISAMTPSSTDFSLTWVPRFLPLLEQPASPAVFAGTNAANPTTGLEGTENDIKGQRVPRAKGRLLGISPVMVNSVMRVFAWNYDKAGNRTTSHSVDAVYYQGSAWTNGGDYVDAAALLASSPAQGTFHTCVAESLIMMGGSNPLSGDVTMNVTIDNPISSRYAATVLQWWLEDAGIPSAAIEADDVTALNTTAPYEIGIYVRDESYREVCDQIAHSVAAWYMSDRLGSIRMKQFTPPAATPDVEFTRYDLDTVATASTGELLSVIPVPSANEQLPAKEVRVGYARNWTVLDAGNVAAAVTDENRQFFVNEYRYTDAATNAGIAARFDNARVIEHQTLLLDETAANAIRDHLLDLYAAQRREFQAEVAFLPALIPDVDLGNTACLTYPKLRMQAGKDYVITGVELNPAGDTATLKLWG